MRLFEKYRPGILADIVGQPSVRLLQAFAKLPYACCFLLEGPPGCGKTTAAKALATELGCVDDFHGLLEITSTELTIDRCREVFDNTLRLRPMLGAGWRVLLIEEFEACTSVPVQRFLKVALETKLPEKCVVVATSNGAGGLERALLQRFKIYAFSGGPTLALAAEERLIEIWQAEGGATDLPPGWRSWGRHGEQFSFRVALDQMQDALTLQEVF